MSESKPFASLGATLLARKGSARPAMRPQNQPLTPVSQSSRAESEHLEDLGWNDMGDDHAAPNPVAALTPSPTVDSAQAVAEPEVRRQQEELAERLAEETAQPDRTGGNVAKAKAKTGKSAPASAKETKKATARARIAADKADKADKKRAAFTLRLDTDRHLMLRLASTMRGRSAQHIVTEALDKLLAETPELKTLAQQMQKR